MYGFITINENSKGVNRMKYFEKSEKEFNTEKQKCPICGADLIETEADDTTAEMVVTMTTLGIL